MKNCIIGQSGGPTAAINASLCGALKAACESKKIEKVYGAVNGIQGVLNENFLDMKSMFPGETERNLLKQTPASYLGSCRYKLPEITETEIYEKIFKIFAEHNIGYFFYIGGNDSMDTVSKLSRYAKLVSYDINIIGIPKTIDNDLTETDHTPGFGSAAKYIAATVRETGLDSDVYDLNSVTIIEIMGRNSGWLTAASALARTDKLKAPHLIYLPEIPFSDEKFFEDIKTLNAQGIKNVVVAVSEGIKYPDGTYVCETVGSGLSDIFGHKNLSGTAKVLENKVRQTLGFKARGIEINVLQRCGGHILSLTDIEEAFAVGAAGVKEAENGGTSKMMVFVRKNNSPYEIAIESREVENIANGEKTVPHEWILNGCDVSHEMIEYLAPLVLGEPEITYKNGIPVYLSR